jgi:hypothetical protein
MSVMSLGTHMLEELPPLPSSMESTDLIEGELRRVCVLKFWLL